MLTLISHLLVFMHYSRFLPKTLRKLALFLSSDEKYIIPCWASGLLAPLEQWYSTGGTRRHLRGYVDYTICITCIKYVLPTTNTLVALIRHDISTSNLYLNTYLYLIVW
jgi:hypothetical protein